MPCVAGLDNATSLRQDGQMVELDGNKGSRLVTDMRAEKYEFGCQIMKNPWLDIPLDDYENHMRSPAIAQLQTLSELFASVLAKLRPKSIAVFGCAAGNGFEHIDPSVTRRVAGVDINPAYLQVAQDRFSHRLPNLDLIEQDFASPAFSIPPVEMVFASLVFEYVRTDQAVRNISNSMAPCGMLVAALQLPSTVSGPVTKSEFCSLEKLAPIMTLVEPDNFTHVCSTNGLTLETKRTIPLKQGKALFVGYYRRGAEQKLGGGESIHAIQDTQCPSGELHAMPTIQTHPTEETARK